MNKNTFFEYNESQAHTGYRSAVLYKEQGDTKYRFLCASETVPFPFGSKESFEFNLLNSRSIGQVEGKATVEQKEIELLYTRNNAFLFEQLKDKVIDFMSITPQMVGYKYHGTISFRPNDAGNDIHRGTYTITPMGVSDVPYLKAREEVLEPLFFEDVIPDEVILSTDNASGVKINVKVVGDYDALYSYAPINADGKIGSKSSLEAEDGILTLPATEGLYVVYAEPQTLDVYKYSGCFTTIYLTK